MRMAILGAGAVGAYVGGRLAQAGVPVAFLAGGDHLHALARDGLRVDSPQGDFSDGQSASLRLRCPHDGKRERAAPTRSSVGPSEDQSSKVLRCYAEGRYGNLSSFCGERR